MASRAVDRGLLKAAVIGRNRVQISHIQFADDTMFILDGDVENAKAIRMLLNNFELASGLSVNFDKCWVFGINMEREELEEMAKRMGCKIRYLLIPYLGMKVGGAVGGDRWLGGSDRKGEKATQEMECENDLLWGANYNHKVCPFSDASVWDVSTTSSFEN